MKSPALSLFVSHSIEFDKPADLTDVLKLLKQIFPQLFHNFVIGQLSKCRADVEFRYDSTSNERQYFNICREGAEHEICRHGVSQEG